MITLETVYELLHLYAKGIYKDELARNSSSNPYPKTLIALHCIALHCIVLYCIVLYCIVLYCIVLYCTVLHCIVLYCIVLKKKRTHTPLKKSKTMHRLLIRGEQKLKKKNNLRCFARD